MKRLVMFICLIAIIPVFIILREPPKGDPFMEGYIVEAGFMYQLVANGITKEQAKSLSQTDLLQLEGINAVKFYKYNFFQYREGQKVKVWIDGGVDESFPGQAKAEYIEVVDEE